MEHSLQLPNPSRSLVIPLVAALLGAGVATTTYALTDGDKASPSRVVIVESSGGSQAAEPTPLSGARP